MSKCIKCCCKRCYECFQTVFLLVWKNWVLFTRCPVLLILMLLFPILVLFASIMGLGFSGVTQGDKPDNMTNDTGADDGTDNPSIFNQMFNDTGGEATEAPPRLMQQQFFLLYSPINNAKINKALMQFQDYGINLIGFVNPLKAEEYFIRNQHRSILGIVEFEENFNNENESLPENLKVVIRLPRTLRRWQMNNWHSVLTTLQEISDGGSKEQYRMLENYSGRPFERQETAEGDQAAAGNDTSTPAADGDASGGNDTNATEQVKEIDEKLREKLSTLALFIFAIGFAPIFFTLVGYVADERTCGLKELMYSMGLCRYHYWSAWFILANLMLQPLVLLMLIFLKFNWLPGYLEFNLFQNSNYFLLWITILFYVSAMVLEAFMLSLWLCQTCLTMILATVAYFLPVFLFFLRPLMPLDKASKLTLSVFPQYGLGVFFEAVIGYDMAEEGLTWSNFGEEEVLVVFMMFIFLSLLYLYSILVTEYMEWRWCHLPWYLRCCILSDPCIPFAALFGKKLCCEKWYNSWCTCPKKKFCQTD